MIYYYSPYERTTWRKLQNRYPDVITEENVENMLKTFKNENFSNYDVICINPNVDYIGNWFLK